MMSGMLLAALCVAVAEYCVACCQDNLKMIWWLLTNNVRVKAVDAAARACATASTVAPLSIAAADSHPATAGSKLRISCKKKTVTVLHALRVMLSLMTTLCPENTTLFCCQNKVVVPWAAVLQAGSTPIAGHGYIKLRVDIIQV
jgi:hypothetical protein